MYPLTHAVAYLGQGFAYLLGPPVCRLCSRPVATLSDQLCDTCWRWFGDGLVNHRYCRQCGHTSGPYSLVDERCYRCQGKNRVLLSGIVRVGEYASPLREMIWALKFRGRDDFDKFLGGLLAAALAGSDESSDIDVLAPIPLHWRRRFVRRYNQSELLARETTRQLRRMGQPVRFCSALRRTRHTIPQTSLSLAQRRTNLRQAFAVVAPGGIRDRHVCLIDDISTTGTTLRQAARVLRRNGARRVSAAVLAVAGNNR